MFTTCRVNTVRQRRDGSYQGQHIAIRGSLFIGFRWIFVCHTVYLCGVILTMTYNGSNFNTHHLIISHRGLVSFPRQLWGLYHGNTILSTTSKGGISANNFVTGQDGVVLHFIAFCYRGQILVDLCTICVRGFKWATRVRLLPGLLLPIIRGATLGFRSFKADSFPVTSGLRRTR